MTPADAGEARLRLTICGRVQGVFFRGSAAREAQKLGVTGYARNRADGTVEIVAEGQRAALKQFAVWARQGPPQAHIDNVIEEWSEARRELDRFRIA
ncbi:MAG: acylphosphatase [Candidatus Binataceae bacterium]|jgi:acylphosphatase